MTTYEPPDSPWTPAPPPKNKSKKWWIVGGVVVVLIGIGVAASPSDDPASEKITSAPIPNRSERIPKPVENTAQLASCLEQIQVVSSVGGQVAQAWSNYVSDPLYDIEDFSIDVQIAADELSASPSGAVCQADSDSPRIQACQIVLTTAADSVLGMTTAISEFLGGATTEADVAVAMGEGADILDAVQAEQDECFA